MKRFLVMVLAVCLTVACVPMPAVAAASKAITSVEDNTTFEAAQTIPLSTTVNVPASTFRVEAYFRFESTSERGFILAVDKIAQYDIFDVKVYDENYKQVAAMEYTAVEYDDYFFAEVAKPKGTYYAVIGHRDSYYSEYDFSVIPAEPIKSIKFGAKSGKLGLGVKGRPRITVKPDYALYADVKWKSSNTKIATVDSTGYITAKKKGKVTITAYSAANSKIKGTMTVNVTNNVYSVSRPRYGSKKGYIYISTKKVYYKGKDIYADIYFYNKTGVTLGRLREVETYLVDLASSKYLDECDTYGSKYVSNWAPKGGIRNNSYKVFTVKFGKGPGYKLNLVEGRYQPYVYYFLAYRKALGDRPELIMHIDRAPGGYAFE